MTAERVRELLKRYNTNRGRRGHLMAEIAESDIEYARTRRELLIAAASPGAQVISDVPRGTGVSDKVGELAGKLADGWEPDELKAIAVKRQRLTDELQLVEVELKYVESWIEALTPRERLVVTEHCLNGRVWRETAVLFNAEFGEDYSRMGLKAIMCRALDKIETVAR